MVNEVSRGTLTLGQVLDEAERALSAHGVWTPREDAETLAAHVLGVESGALSPDATLGPAAIARLREFIGRRAGREPLAYLTGRASFGGITLSVGPGVFVPRPHSEPMLAWGLQMLAGRSQPVVVDLCTGCGAIALAVAKARPDAVVHAVDRDPAALDYARSNARTAGNVPVRLHAVDVAEGTALRGLEGSVDLVLANPPYVAESKELLPEWSEHHPRQAIYSGADGLELTRHVVRLAARLLRPGGGAAVEHDDAQGPALAGLLAGAGFAAITDRTDHHGEARFTTASLAAAA